MNTSYESLSSERKDRVAGAEARWGVQIPLRDGVHLAAILYRPRDCVSPRPVIVAMTPYVAQIHHEKARYLAERGHIFVAVDVRGRGNSGGDFVPFQSEGRDGYDVIEWIASQSFCDGNVAMCGASYEAYTQWRTAAERPPHLRTILPIAAPYLGLDFPFRKNIASPYLMQWLTVVAGRTAQEKLFADREFYSEQFSRWAGLARSFRQLDEFLGHKSAVFQEWMDHSSQSDYWDRLNPTPEQYSQITIPILTITGCYDGDQLGALKHHHEHLAHAPADAQRQHYLIIGPWDHGGTVRPTSEVGGLRLGDASAIDLHALRRQWCDWTLQAGVKPTFLKARVAYYVMGAEMWRYADTLEEITTHHESLFLQSRRNPTDVAAAGLLSSRRPGRSDPAQYIDDPLDVSLAAMEATVDPDCVTDQSLIYAAGGRQLIYDSRPFSEPLEIAGFFKLALWLAIDQRDADFRARIHEIAADESSVLLSADWIRARFREDLRSERLIDSTEPLKYEFNGFQFIARRIARGSRLRLVIDSFNSIYTQRNFNGGGSVVDESAADARAVTVRLVNDPEHPSALYVPYGRVPGCNRLECDDGATKRAD